MPKRLLEQCEREQLHLSGEIQSHGALIVLDADGLVGWVSANIGDYIDRPAAAWLGAPLPTVLAARFGRLLEEVVTEPGRRQFGELSATESPGRYPSFDVTIVGGNAGQRIIELTPAIEAPVMRGKLPAPSQWDNDHEVIKARHALVEEIALLTGAHRVMYYEFNQEGDGEVIAEVREESRYGSYLGLRFPASDIPQIARALYLKNPWRQIPDIEARPIPIIGRSPQPPDLTWSDLRSVSPIHLTYLANMGVRSSLSFPVVVAGALTALIAVHHREPLPLSRLLLEDISDQVRHFSLNMTSLRSRQRMRLIDNLQHRFSEMRALLQVSNQIEDIWPQLSDWLAAQFRADGATLFWEDNCLHAGIHLEQPALAVLDTWFRAQREPIWTGDSLSRQIPDFPLSEIAGVLALRIHLPNRPGVRLYLTRSEHLHEVTWGGNPDKPMEYHDGTLGVAPRRSFAKWVEKRIGYCRPWDNEARLLALRLRDLLLREISG